MSLDELIKALESLKWELDQVTGRELVVLRDGSLPVRVADVSVETKARHNGYAMEFDSVIVITGEGA